MQKLSPRDVLEKNNLKTAVLKNNGERTRCHEVYYNEIIKELKKDWAVETIRYMSEVFLKNTRTRGSMGKMLSLDTVEHWPSGQSQKQAFTDVLQKGVLKNLANFAGKYLCWSLFLIKLQA